MTPQDPLRTALDDLMRCLNAPFPVSGDLAASMLQARAALALPPRQDGTETNCPLGGVHEHPFRGPHRFHEWEPGT